MNTSRLHERIGEYVQAVSRLEDALRQPKNEFIRDAVIQRFEFCFELAWKMLRLKLQDEGLAVNTPRETLQQALTAGMLADGNGWSAMQKMRNLTSHTYDESLAEQVYVYVAQPGTLLLRQLAKKATTWSMVS